MSDRFAPLRRICTQNSDGGELLAQAARFVRDEFNADAVCIAVRTESGLVSRSAVRSEVPGVIRALVDIAGGELAISEVAIPIPFCISNVQTSRAAASHQKALRASGIRSFAAVPIYQGEKLRGFIECRYSDGIHLWRRHELQFLERSADCIGAGLLCDPLPEAAPPAPPVVDAPPAVVPPVSAERRFDVLYDLARSIDARVDPSVIALRTLRTLLGAIEADCGAVALFERNIDQLELSAVERCNAEEVTRLAAALSALSVEQIQGLVADAQLLTSAELRAHPLGEGIPKDVQTALFVPFRSGDNDLGVFAAFRRNGKPFSHEDRKLVEAACALIGLVLKHAESFASERRSATSFATLYRLSHELSKHSTAREVGEHAFPIIQQEIPSRRMWLATMNEFGTHLIGQAGVGPGMRRRIVQVQIELNLRHDFLDQALEKREPQILPRGAVAECSGLTKILNRLEIGTLVILPLVSLGQVVGIFVLEPQSAVVAESKLALLGNIASEIATVIFARRFESRMADAEKMRVMSALASGVAHNFNNLLQAVMGQASLIEMQLPADSPLVQSARMIVESAQRGASLVSHLTACTSPEPTTRQALQLSAILPESRDFYRSILGSPIDFELDITAELPEVMADFSRLQQVVSNLLVNAKESLSGRFDGRVVVRARRVRVLSGEIDADLPPGAYVRIDVSDNGPGMSPEEQVRCFEPIFGARLADARPGGAGLLGLSSAFMIMRQHGGAITVQSEQGVGSTFSVYIPVAQREESTVRRTRRATRDGAEVVLVDVDDALTESIDQMVASLGIFTADVRRKQRALDLLQSSGDRVRLLVIDVDRFEEDAVPFVREIVHQHLKLRVAVVTFDARKWERVLADVPRVEFMRKPLSVWALNQLLKQFVLGRATSNLDLSIEKQASDASLLSRDPEDEASLSTDADADKESEPT